MPSPLKVVITLEQDRQLLEITHSAASSKRTKQRAEALRLSSHGWTVYQIAEYFNCNPQTIRQTIHKWEKEGISGLDDRPKTGRPRQWQDEDLRYLEKCLREDGQVYNAKQLSQKLQEDRGVTLSSDRIRKILKQKGWVWKRARISHKDKQDPELKAKKEAELAQLKREAEAGRIRLKYLDETGFSCWSGVIYGWIEEGKSKRLEQTKSRGKRVSLLGVFEPGRGFSGGFTAGSITSKEYIEFMDKEAEKAEKTLQIERAPTVIPQDNSSVHTCKAVKAKIPEWEKKGLFFFQLPPYCSEMNLIELEWLHLKRDEIAGKMFINEDYLMWGIEAALKSRYEGKGMDVSYFEFSFA